MKTISQGSGVLYLSINRLSEVALSILRWSHRFRMVLWHWIHIKELSRRYDPNRPPLPRHMWEEEAAWRNRMTWYF